MLHRIRDVRVAKGLTLAQVAERCEPPTTAQTVGRLETGTRTLSLAWLNRIAAALGVDSSALVDLPDQQNLPVAAILGPKGAQAPRKPETIPGPVIEGEMVGMRIAATHGEYRAGDQIWLRRVAPDDYGNALNRDILVPRPAGRFLFGRLIARDGEKLQILPLGAGQRQQIVNEPAWLGIAAKLVRDL